MTTAPIDPIQTLSPLDKLRAKREQLAKWRAQIRQHYFVSTVSAFGCLIVGPILAYNVESYLWRSLLLLYALAPIPYAALMRGRLRGIEIDLQEIDFQIDLQESEATLRQSRAEKLLRLNTLQLRRYYDLNLSQNIWVFCLGIVCILLGLGVAAATIYVVNVYALTYDAKVITAILGALGSILTNFVAVIFLHMHASATRNLAGFHSRLVATQQSLFGNLLASLIDNDEKREKTLAQLALRFAGRKDSGLRAKKPPAKQPARGK